jgi:Domain of Unknown Function (DUF1080)
MEMDCRKTLKTQVWALMFTAIAGGTVFAQGGPNDTVWTKIWNGTNLSDWDIKFQGSALNVNLNNTFRAVDGNLEVNYSGWTGFNNQFGHAGYKVRPFSFYFIRAEHQHWGAQPSGSPGWARENNGLMLHSQSVASMGQNQDFPVSMEVQLLGSGNTESDNNSTLNLCTPGTAFYTTPTGGTRNDSHCFSASTNTRVGTGVWQWSSVLVMGDSIIRHYNGPTATGTPTLTWYRPVRATNSGAGGITIPMVNNERITEGYITIQAETHPYRFRTIEVLNLVGCMTPGNANYKSYFVRHDATACGTTGINEVAARANMRLVFGKGRVTAQGIGKVTLTAHGLDGKVLGQKSGQAPLEWAMPDAGSGLSMIKVVTEKGSFTEKAARI